MDLVGFRQRCFVADPSGVWCVQLQGGGGRQGGALATDDNAADARARPRDPDKIQTTPPRSCPQSGGLVGLFVVRRHELTDESWAVIEPFLAP
ncbi:hypothetical protein KVH23_27630, partial [Streptomyces olivaceus]|nr:hypothetical protein [Streptomyces olivaceus]MBZ6126964.1 hypothetical protein [Streptomyces olivaceus]MBZ6147977.1 hypothetical protein [Streptomyces olivaceus]MBZ6161416.1 hypothetical protein [Streptomyces olivaceus]MBZ6189555.1 hypothetical protein [Streptomyces olivaceus]